MSVPVPARSASLSCSIRLPPGFRENDILAFHKRDPLAVAERVDGRMLKKGLAWNGHAACLIIEFHEDCADAGLAVDGPAGRPEALTAMVRRMLGLNQRIEDFEQTYRSHPQLGPLIAGQRGLRVPISATPFEALTWAVTGQQISLNAAISMRRKLILATGLKHSSGLYCYPEARQLAKLSTQDLRQAGFSQTKAQTLLVLSRMIQESQLPLDEWMTAAPPVDEMRSRLSRIHGIGPWTINYTLLRGFGWLDGSLHGDVAVRRGLQLLLGASEKITEQQAQLWLAPFSPWRALVAAHLWTFLAQTRVKAGNGA